MRLDFSCNFSAYKAAIFRSYSGYLHGISDIMPISLCELVGIDFQKKSVVANIKNFLEDRVAQNILLWGARGSGKTALVRAVLLEFWERNLRIVQVLHSDLWVLPELCDSLRLQPYRFLILLDDVSFELGSDAFKSLKALFDGGVEDRAKNILICATSNRRHLLAQMQDENELFGYEGDEDRIALSDRFGLSLGFYASGKREFEVVLEDLFARSGLDFKQHREKILRDALNFATQKGSYNPRIAKQFFEMYQNGLLLN